MSTRSSLRMLGFTALLLLTGAAGLIYEVAWQRYLGVLIGFDHAASAATLGLFLGGLSLGYALCGRLSARSTHPLRVYAWLELTIGGWGLLFPWLFVLIQRLTAGFRFESPLALVAASLAVAAPLILIPAMLMGATVPFMTRGLAQTREGLTATHARVYGWNTFGAVAGALGSAFVLLPHLGPAGAVRLAALFNLVTAFILLGMRTRPAATEPATQARRRPTPWILAPIALLCGAATMAQETALIRLLGLALGPTTLPFALVIAAFIISIAVGSLLVSRARSISKGALGWSCVASSAAWLLLFATYDAWPWALHALRFAFGGDGLSFIAYHLLVALALSIVLLPAVAPMGAILPLLFHARNATLSESGQVSGVLLAWGAVGSLIGSVAGGIWLYAFVDLGQALLVAPFLTATMALIAAFAAGARLRVAAVSLVAATAVLAVLLPGFDIDRFTISSYRLRETQAVSFAGPSAFQEAYMVNREIVYRRDGPLDTVAVVEAPAWELPIPRPREIYINGKSDSNTLRDIETLRLSAHLPMLLADDPKRALVIGQGTGVTLGELTLWPELEAVDLVEISPHVLETLPLFADHTRDVMSDPRVSLHTHDARFFLRSSTELWDVIISEPSNLWVGHNDLLFTESFLKLIASRLSEGGILLQWVHLYETDRANLCSVIATIDSVFPHTQAFRGTEGDWLVVASRDPLRPLDETRLGSDVQSSLAQASTDPLSSRRVEGFADCVKRSRDCPVHTDLDLSLNYRAMRAMFTGDVLSEDDL